MTSERAINSSFKPKRPLVGEYVPSRYLKPNPLLKQNAQVAPPQACDSERSGRAFLSDRSSAPRGDEVEESLLLLPTAAFATSPMSRSTSTSRLPATCRWIPRT